MERWSGKVALVTGASAGIGAAIAVELVKKGLIVVGLARRVEKVEELKKYVDTRADKLYPFQGDVSKEEDITKVFKFIKEKFGKIHVLVNNAGILRNGNFLDSDPKYLKETIDVNIVGLTLCTQQAFKLMKDTGVDDGYIILISSVLGHTVANVPGLNIYPATKFAITAITETIRQELRNLKSNIRVTTVSPGGVATEFVDAAFKGVNKELSQEYKDIIAAAPMLKGQDIADSVVYVLSTPPHVQVHEIIIKPVGEMV